ncbi:MAG: DUF4301 family protein, partial [Syntrophaceae bacterium]|nr:DUF4301 family protein [Syntrophaceae bacterium]
MALPLDMWSDRDRIRMTRDGIAVAEADWQLAIFRRGVSPLRLIRPCRAGDGIAVIPEREMPALLERYEGALQERRVVKFVPASGGATRMFKDWYRFLEGEGFTDQVRSRFLADLGRYAFFPDLAAVLAAKGVDLQTLIATGNAAAVLEGVLTDKGLGYGHLPKALLKFHATPEGSRTALEEHLVEAALYARDGRNVSRLHLTLSAEHIGLVRSLLERIQGDYEERWETRFEIGFSTQDPATNTLAVDPEGRPFRDEAGELVFRPGGHGALVTNFNALDADIVFVKNIDNCVPDRLKLETVFWKRLLAGYLLALQEEIFAALRLLTDSEPVAADLERITDFGQERLNLVFPQGFVTAPPAERCRILRERLHRPLRV